MVGASELSWPSGSTSGFALRPSVAEGKRNTKSGSLQQDTGCPQWVTGWKTSRWQDRTLLGTRQQPQTSSPRLLPSLSPSAGVWPEPWSEESPYFLSFPVTLARTECTSTSLLTSAFQQTPTSVTNNSKYLWIVFPALKDAMVVEEEDEYISFLHHGILFHVCGAHRLFY